MEIGSGGYHFGIHFLPRPAAHHRDVDPLKPASGCGRVVRHRTPVSALTAEVARGFESHARRFFGYLT